MNQIILYYSNQKYILNYDRPNHALKTIIRQLENNLIPRRVFEIFREDLIKKILEKYSTIL